MKRYIRSAREYNTSRAIEYKNKQAAKQKSKELELQRQKYVDSIKESLSDELESEIDSAIFEPVLTEDVIDTYVAYYTDRYSKYFSEDELKSGYNLSWSSYVWIKARPEYMEIIVDVFGAGADGHGLEWIADLETGGDGGVTNNYISKLPARIKRKFAEYKDTIADLIEGHGFEILEAPTNNSLGFVYKVTNDEYDALTV